MLHDGVVLLFFLDKFQLEGGGDIMSRNRSRKKTKKPVQGAPGSCKKVYGEERQEILEQTGIPSVYFDKAVVKRDKDGQLHIYYGGIGPKSYHFHGHMKLDKNGKICFHRLPFAKHYEVEVYSDGKLKRGRKFKRRFYY